MIRRAVAFVADRLPFVVVTQRTLWQEGKNGFELGRDWQRAIDEGKVDAR